MRILKALFCPNVRNIRFFLYGHNRKSEIDVHGNGIIPERSGLFYCKERPRTERSCRKPERNDAVDNPVNSDTRETRGYTAAALPEKSVKPVLAIVLAV